MKKNILIIIWTLEQWWGAEKVCSIIWNELNNKNYSVHFITYYRSSKSYSITGELYCFNEKVSKNIIVNLLKLIMRSYNISQYCKKNNIHTSISFMEDINFCNIISKIFFRNKAKIIVSVHNNVNKISGFSRRLIKLIYNYSDKVVTVVQEEKENLITNYNINKDIIKVIYNPIIIDHISGLQRKEIQANNNSIFENDTIFTFINIWRLITVKNQKVLIECYKEFEKSYPNSQLIILGEWELRWELEYQIGESKKIHLLWLQENPYNFLAKSNCFLFSSLNEGFWIVLTEALACWLPIISYDCPTGPKEILKENISEFVEVTKISYEKYWILVPNENKVMFLDAMKKIYTDYNLKRQYNIISKNRAQDFDIKEIISQWEDII